MPTYLQPVNWDDWQDRRVSQYEYVRNWTELLHHPDYRSLSPGSRSVLHGLWMLYGMVGRPLAYDCGYLAQALGLDPKYVGRWLDPLLSNNFIEITEDNSRRSPRKTKKKQETSHLESDSELEEESPPKVPPKGDDEKSGLNGSVNKPPSRKEIAETMAATWNEILPRLGLPEVKKLTETRVKTCNARFREHLGEDFDQWRTLCYRIAASDFLTGKTERGEGHGSWICDFDFAIRSSGCTKILEGKYDNRQTAAAAAAANVRSDGL